MISDADTVGVFQIESRAQMSMLPRLRPNRFYDLVIEVAIVRPGPIQGEMVHPYLRRRNGLEPITYPSEDLKEVLSRTLGIPIFQEQAMGVAMKGAGLSGEEADRFRRAMSSHRSHELTGCDPRPLPGGLLAERDPAADRGRNLHQAGGVSPSSASPSRMPPPSPAPAMKRPG